jgi:hypothetical protein
MTIPCLPTVKTRRFFAGGRAPLCWQEQLKRPSTTAKIIERACNWLPELTGQPAPKLRTRPLFGDCLAELVTPLPPVEEPAPATEPKRPRMNEQRPSTNHVINRKGNQFPAQPQKDRPKPGAQPARATAAVLSRLAGQPGSARQQRPSTDHATSRKTNHSPAQQQKGEAKPGAQPARATAAVLSRLAGQSGSTRQQRPSINRQPLPTSSRHTWPEQLTNSVRRRLVTETIAPAVISGLERLPAPEYGLPQDLAAQWQQPLTGQTVSAEQLAAWQNKIDASDVSGNGKPANATTDNGRTTNTTTPHHEQGTAEIRPSPTFYRRGRKASLTSGRRNQTGTPVRESGEEAGTAVYHDTDETSVDTTDRFAPPQMAATLPGLRPPPWPGAARDEMMGTAVTAPIATLIARESAAREAATTPEDLDDLARKLTQILDEESRRHGIDV